MPLPCVCLLSANREPRPQASLSHLPRAQTRRGAVRCGGGTDRARGRLPVGARGPSTACWAAVRFPTRSIGEFRAFALTLFLPPKR